MSQSISAVEARQKFGEMLNRVALLREEIIIEKYRHCLREIYKLNDVLTSFQKML